MSSTPSAFNNLPDSVKSLVSTTMVTGIEPLFALGWNDEDIAALIAHFVDGIGKNYVGNDPAFVLRDLAQRRTAWQAKKAAGGNGASSSNGNGHAEPAPSEGLEEARQVPEYGARAEFGRHQCASLCDLRAGFRQGPSRHLDRDRDRGSRSRRETRPARRSAKHFSVFELEKAAAYAVQMNKLGRNVYVGMALRQGETGPSGRATKANVVTASRGWGDFDKEGRRRQN